MADAQLVDKGREQAHKLGAALIQWSKENGMPLPGTIYTSPLTRCLETTNLIYSDARRSRASIEERYPECSFEPDFINEDTLWTARTNDGPENAETEDEHIARNKGLLEDIFETDIAQFVSLTTHSYAISALLSVVGSPPIRFKEGAMLAILVKSEKEPSRGIFKELRDIQAKGDVKAYLEGDEDHDYAEIDKWAQARTPFTDPPNEKLAKGDTACIIANKASFDVAQYLHKPSAAGMSMIHLLALPRDSIYNGVSLTKDNVRLIEDMITLFQSS
ncbi:histidine phosphatase superfamily [Apiospora arundinis]|uniref:Histidine phosphatase superfamily n=1 Tax=Apiospora arundinis TaxID=335852 RepID=A0ABR2IWH1_9PEZI